MTVTADGSYITNLLYTEDYNGKLVTGASGDSIVWDTVHFNANFMTVPNDALQEYTCLTMEQHLE